jgi:hypothetical protein
MGCQAFYAKINLIHMGPVGILSMLYFAQNALFYPKEEHAQGAKDLDAITVFPVRACAAPAPGDRIVRGWPAL